MKIKISATFEGTCQLCGNEKMVFMAGDEDSKKVVCVCKECADSLGDVPTFDVIEKYGKEDEELFKSEGINIQRLDEVQKKLEEKKKATSEA